MAAAETEEGNRDWERRETWASADKDNQIAEYLVDSYKVPEF